MRTIRNPFKLVVGLIIFCGYISVFIKVPFSAADNIDTILEPPKINFDSLSKVSIDSQEPIENHYINFDSLAMLLENSFPSALQVMGDLKLFGAYQDSATSPSTDSLFLRLYENKLNRIAIDANEKPYLILKRFSFAELPCLKMYLLNYFTGGEWHRYKYTGALFNDCDSTIYIYGGDIGDFNDVIRRYLPIIKKEHKLADLINLYLNTFSISDKHMIISDTNDYKNIWEWRFSYKLPLWRDQIRNDFLPQITKELDQFAGSFHKIKYELAKCQEGDFYYVSLCAWGLRYGKLEEWDFRISDQVFEVYNVEPIAIKVGPWNLYH